VKLLIIPSKQRCPYHCLEGICNICGQERNDSDRQMEKLYESQAVSHPFETDDCTVLALAHVLNSSYAEAHAICEAAGRKPRTGMFCIDIHRMLKGLAKSGRILSVRLKRGKEYVLPPRYEKRKKPVLVRGKHGNFYRSFPRKATTIAEFLKDMPKKGRFYISGGGHSFSMVDGMLLNPTPRIRAYMTGCWEIKLKPSGRELNSQTISTTAG